jgi:hypothetical protein
VDWRDPSGEIAQNPSTSLSTAPTGTRAFPLRRRPWYFWLLGGCFGVLLLLGAFCGALGGLAIGVYQFAVHEPTATAATLRTFTVHGAPQVLVNNPAGSVTFAPGDTGTVRVEATRRARDQSEEAARNALATITLDLRQDGEMVSVVARFAGPGSNWPGASRLVDLLITVPMRSDVTVNQGAGDVSFGALTGPVSAHVDAGNVRVTGATMTGASQVQVGAGNITFDGSLAEGAALDARIDAGAATLTLPATVAAHIEAQTGVGAISVQGWPISPRHRSGAKLLAEGDTQAGALTHVMVAVEAGDITIQAR